MIVVIHQQKRAHRNRSINLIREKRDTSKKPKTLKLPQAENSTQSYSGRLRLARAKDLIIEAPNLKTLNLFFFEFSNSSEIYLKGLAQKAASI